MFNIFSNKKVYFIGIGGIGVSALAKLALTQRAKKVSGTDLIQSDITNELEKQGAKIEIGKLRNWETCLPPGKIKKLGNYNLVIYSTAVPDKHAILTQARKLKIPCLTYPQILGEISKSFFTIAVSGMHGKSTTTAMIGIMLESAGLDPLVIVGTKVKEWGGNIRIIKNLKLKIKNCNSKFKNKKIKNGIFVVEADEYRSAMLNLKPDIIVLTRIEEDHLDYYRDINHIKNEFRKYLRRLSSNGVAVVNWGDENIKDIVSLFHCFIVKYNYQDDEIRQKIRKVLKVPGEHNIENALAAYKVGERLGLAQKQILNGLAKFKGTWRRMELVGKLEIKKLRNWTEKRIKNKFQVSVVSDYAHHPTEIKATLQALREKYLQRRIVLAYQPHQHNRTKKLFSSFISSFDQTDVLILNEIFDVAGREADNDQNISSKNLVREIKKRIGKLRNWETCLPPGKIKKLGNLKECYYSANLRTTKKKILQLVKPNDIIVIMGAGDIDKVARELACQKL